MEIQTFSRRITASISCVALLLLPPAVRSETGGTSSPPIGYEVVGQVLNPSAQQSLQYGYLNRVRGLDRITTSAGAVVSEATALFTFFNDTATEQVINNGPIRVVDRTGTGAIYFGSGNADFTNPNSFKQGTPIQTFTLRHQVVIDTSTGYFTTTFEITVTSAKTFQIDGNTYHLGRRGDIYRLNVSGKLTQQAPPSAYVGGAADGPGVEVMEID
ncbi:MAG TPA: hypothetical protein VKB88_33590 [Bryobacteraceae bacterium]|nr:hypothetical protein [Bryobacteraceae bacterium]